MAEFLLLELVAPDTVVTSRGTLSVELEVPPEIRALATARGNSTQALMRTGRRVSQVDLLQADVVLTMTREQLRTLVIEAPSVWPKTFTLKEFVRRGRATGMRRTEPLSDWLARLHAGRTKTELVGDSAVDDISDPYGGSSAAYSRTFDEITELVNDVVRLLRIGREKTA